nr:MAG: hypothetical protein H1RhizoLitter15373_000002 [Mitovirus sp.]
MEEHDSQAPYKGCLRPQKWETEFNISSAMVVPLVGGTAMIIHSHVRLIPTKLNVWVNPALRPFQSSMACGTRVTTV